MSKILLLLAMIFLHIVDDYYLQGWLASAKQKSWWEKNAPDDLYKHDYLMALSMHGFSWTFMIMLVPAMYALYMATDTNVASFQILCVFAVNLIAHVITDNRKANKKEINLIEDQLFHLNQLFWTWLYLVWMR